MYTLEGEERKTRTRPPMRGVSVRDGVSGSVPIYWGLTFDNGLCGDRDIGAGRC